jgi:hypothetical protein
MGLPGKDSQTGLPGQDCQDRSVKTGQPGQDNRDRTTKLGLPGKIASIELPGQYYQPRSQNRTSKTGQPGRTVQIFSITSSQLKKSFFSIFATETVIFLEGNYAF